MNIFQSIIALFTFAFAAADISSSLMNNYLQNMVMHSGMDPSILHLLTAKDQGLGTKDFFMLQMLSGLGIQPELMSLLLNKGKFDDDDEQNKNAMVNFLASSGLIPAAFIPFLVKGDNAEEFMIFNMIESGELDPIFGLIMLGNADDEYNKDDIFEIISQSTLYGDTDALLSGITKPYVPVLPDGIFPGSELYFAHFERLAISTCSLHDLRNRFDCGYVGIAAADCEFLPYCCYSPVFMTDEQVSESTEGDITAASAVPWCYYNIFFVYPTDFSLVVKLVGEFASPLQCPEFWKYGLKLDDGLASAAAASGSLSSLTNPREECGFPGITQFHCVAIRGCCWDKNAPAGTAQCFQPKDIPSFDQTNIPDAFKPVNGMCDLNVYQIPLLYYLRQPATYPLEFHSFGFDLLVEPNREDCLTRIGACWEADERIVAKYPRVPRCYRRTSNDNLSPVVASNLLLARSGGNGNGFVNPDKFPPAQQETTTPQPQIAND